MVIFFNLLIINIISQKKLRIKNKANNHLEAQGEEFSETWKAIRRQERGTVSYKLQYSISCVFRETNKKKRSIVEYRSWRLKNILLENKKVEENVEEICKKIPSLKDKYGKLWYDYFIKELIEFLKEKSKEHDKLEAKEKN